MTFESILNDLKNKKFAPVYFLTGEESYFIDLISDHIEEQILTEDEKEFNLTILYGKETDAPGIISNAKRFPMMAEYQVVIVKEAQDVRDLDQLQSYIENPLTSTILVLCYKHKKFDKRKVLAKTIQKNGVFFESQRIYENRIPEWIKNYLSGMGYHITPKATLLLSQYLGANLSRITNEIGKLTINLDNRTEITDKHIDEYIGINKDYNVFELQNALGRKDIFKANQIVNYFAANEKDHPLVMVVIILNSFFVKLMIYHQLKNRSKNNVASALSVNPYFVQDYEVAARNYNLKKLVSIISYLREYDLKAKGVENVSVRDGELLKELVFKILH
jgi:DNA polymerase-3 subunit delta